jgi:crossover junction endodeoxyribonuclease RuvC
VALFKGETMKILGIDPGLGRIGFGLIDVSTPQSPLALGWGVIETTPKSPIGKRLVEIHHDIHALIRDKQPDVIAIESLFYFRNNTTIVPVAQARGVILLLAELAGVPTVDYTPMQVKQALTGYGKAEKHAVTEAVIHRLGLLKKPTPDDAADGLAIALTHSQFTS